MRIVKERREDALERWRAIGGVGVEERLFKVAPKSEVDGLVVS